jgi:hypothetical protein
VVLLIWGASDGCQSLVDTRSLSHTPRQEEVLFNTMCLVAERDSVWEGPVRDRGLIIVSGLDGAWGLGSLSPLESLYP